MKSRDHASRPLWRARRRRRQLFHSGGEAVRTPSRPPGRPASRACERLGGLAQGLHGLRIVGGGEACGGLKTGSQIGCAPWRSCELLLLVGGHEGLEARPRAPPRAGLRAAARRSRRLVEGATHHVDRCSGWYRGCASGRNRSRPTRPCGCAGSSGRNRTAA